MHLLSDSEIAAWLMFRHLRQQDVAEQNRAGVAISGEGRVRYYGLSKEAWNSHRMLERFGLLQVEAAPGRRPDGTYEDYDAASPPPLHRFQVTDEALSQPAGPAVKAAVAAAIDDQH